MKRAWVTGAGGLIGRYVVEAVTPQSAQFEIVALTRPMLDLTDFAAVEKRFQADRPDLAIHCAAMSKTPDCQANPKLARQINVDATLHLAALAVEIDFIFFSTDLVFDGRKGNYVESDAVNPLSTYAETKVEAELPVLKNSRHTVLRTSLNSGTSPRGDSAYNEQLVTMWKSGRAASLFVDEFRTPIPACVTARAVWEMAVAGRPGLFHLAGKDRLSRVEIGRLAAARHPELNPAITTSALREYRGAPRPPDTSLNCAKIQQALSFPLPSLAQYLNEHPEEPF